MDQLNEEMLTSVERLSRDIRASAATLSDEEARYLVDAYYIMQDQRLRTEGQIRALTDSEEPHTVINWLSTQSSILEDQVKGALDKYTGHHPMGSWMKSVKGIGPVLSAGLLAHIDITQAPTVGHIWRFAGLDPSSKWIGKKGAETLVERVVGGTKKVTEEMLVDIAKQAGIRREALDGNDTAAKLKKRLAKCPWNARLKVLCWKIGESFVKVSGGDAPGYYGLVYKARKEWESKRNEAGELADQAVKALEAKNFRADTIAKAHYLKGQLPPAHIHRRATRYASKLFLAHLHHRWYEHHFGKPPPKPYVISILGHGHYIPPPE